MHNTDGGGSDPAMLLNGRHSFCYCHSRNMVVASPDESLDRYVALRNPWLFIYILNPSD